MSTIETQITEGKKKRERRLLGFISFFLFLILTFLGSFFYDLPWLSQRFNSAVTVSTFSAIVLISTPIIFSLFYYGLRSIFIFHIATVFACWFFCFFSLYASHNNYFNLFNDTPQAWFQRSGAIVTVITVALECLMARIALSNTESIRDDKKRWLDYEEDLIKQGVTRDKIRQERENSKYYDRSTGEICLDPDKQKIINFSKKIGLTLNTILLLFGTLVWAYGDLFYSYL